MTSLITETATAVQIDTSAEEAKLNVGGGIYAHSPEDDFAAVILRPNDGDNICRIQVRGDNEIVHSEILIRQIATTGTGNPTDSRIEIRTMDGGSLVTRLTVDENGNIIGSTGKSLVFRAVRALDVNGFTIFADDGSTIAIHAKDNGDVGIGNEDPQSALDVTGRIKVRGTATNTDWDEFTDGQIAIKVGSGIGERCDITFHREDGSRVGGVQSSEERFVVYAGEDEDSAVFSVMTNGKERIVVDDVGNVAIGGFSYLSGRPTNLGPFHVKTDLFATNYIFAESPTNLIGATPVVLIDREDSGPNVGVKLAVGFAMIYSSDSVFATGAFINLKNNTTQVVTLDGSNALTFEIVNGSAQLTVYRSAGTKGYMVSFMGMYT